VSLSPCLNYISREQVDGAGVVQHAAAEAGAVGLAVHVRGAERGPGVAGAQRQTHPRAGPPRRMQRQDARRQQLQGRQRRRGGACDLAQDQWHARGSGAGWHGVQDDAGDGVCAWHRRCVTEWVVQCRPGRGFRRRSRRVIVRA
jgi:hypothetical protein